MICFWSCHFVITAFSFKYTSKRRKNSNILTIYHRYTTLVIYTGWATIAIGSGSRSSFRDCSYEDPESSEENMESSILVLSHTVYGNYNSDGRSDKKLYTTESDIDLDASISFVSAAQLAD